jgi:hypothetical protein
MSDNGDAVPLATVDINHEDDNSDTSSVASSHTSTVQYGQRPFEEFKVKVLDLCAQLWPEKDNSEIQIERLRGGSSHRVIGISIGPSLSKAEKTKNKLWQMFKVVKGLLSDLLNWLQSAKPKSNAANEEFILRIPRFGETAHFSPDFAVLKLVERTTSFPVPKVLQFDETSDNPLSRPYVLQPKFSGESLDILWEKLNHSQRLCIAREIACFLSQLTRETYPCAGRIDPTSVHSAKRPGSEPIRIHQFEYSLLFSSADNLSELAQAMPPSAFLQDRFRGWKAHKKAKGVEDFVPWDALAALVGHLQNTTSVFDPMHGYYLYHGDFYPRNILAEIVDGSTATITAILDWDDCVFAPAIVASKFPSWLWAWDKYESGELEARKLHLAELDIPQDNNSKEIREAFEAGTNPIFLKYASDPHGDVARWLWKFAVEGIYENDAWDLAEEALKEYGLDPTVDLKSDGEEYRGENEPGEDECVNGDHRRGEVERED